MTYLAELVSRPIFKALEIGCVLFAVLICMIIVKQKEKAGIAREKLAND